MFGEMQVVGTFKKIGDGEGGEVVWNEEQKCSVSNLKHRNLAI